MASILIIDDDPQIRSLFREILEQAGYDVFLASNGHDGLQLFRQTPTDLVITDVFMPEIDGLELITTLHHEAPTVPIIAFTGKSEGQEYMKVAMYLGAQCTMAKPVPATELIRAVRQHLREIH